MLRFRQSSSRPRSQTQIGARSQLRGECLERRELLTATVESALSLSAGFGGVANYDIAHDSQGNTYLAGNLSSPTTAFAAGPLDFDPVNSYPDNRDTISDPWTTSFIAKYSPAGAFQWVRSSAGVLNELGDPGNGGFSVSRLAVGASGDIYFSGTYSGSATFAGLTAPYTQWADNRYAGRLNSAGQGVWLKSVNLAAVEFDTAGLAVDEAHNRVYLAGSQMLSNPGSESANVVALNTANPSNVTVAWSASLIATSVQYARASANDVAVDSTGAVYVGGQFQGSADFDPGSGKLSLSSGSGGRFDIPSAGYVWKLSSTGSVVWAKVFEGTRDANSTVSALAVDSGNNVVVAGSFAGPVDFMSGKGTLNLTNDGADIFLAKFTSTGTLTYAKSRVSAGNEGVKDVLLESSGSILVLGARSGSSHDGDFLARFSASGALLGEWSVWGSRMSVNPVTGKLNTIGTFSGPLDLNGDGQVDLVADADPSQADLFWAAYSLG